MTSRGDEPGPPSYAQWVRHTIQCVRSDRHPVVNLFDSSVPEPLELLQKLVLDGFSDPITDRYTSAFAGGNPFVIAELARRYGVGEEAVLCTTGATGALSLICQALLTPGDRVLVENPGFDLFHAIPRAYGFGVDSFERRGERFTIDPDEVAAAIGPRTRLVILSNLHNPSGMAADEATLAEIGRIVEARGITVVVDEVYGDYAPASVRMRSAAHLSPAIIAVSSLTKIFGLSTLRCGWIVAHPERIAPIRALNDEVEFGVSNLAHGVAALVLEHSDRFTDYWTEYLRRARPVMEAWHRDCIAQGLIEGALPDYGCIAFPRLVDVEDGAAFSEWLAERSGVIVAPGGYFGASDHVRIGFAQAPDALDYGLQAFTEGLIAYRDRHAEPRTRLSKA